MREAHTFCVRLTQTLNIPNDFTVFFGESSAVCVGLNHANQKASLEDQSGKSLEVHMNEEDKLTPPPIISTATIPIPPSQPPRDTFGWIRKVLACNPFYLLSAALLLFGCYRLSSDTSFLKSEWTQLLFNLSSLQFYEIVLVFTAIFLARRRLWYDSTLLVILENMLVLVPFIFLSQAALIDTHSVGLICGIGGAVALMRFAGLKRFFPQLNLPRRILALGFVLLSLNVALPLIYRSYGETKLANNLECPAYFFNEYAWFLILPAAFALANFVPYAKGTGSLLPHRRWLPSAAFTFWIIGTSIHVYSLSYVYDFKMRADFLAPTLWVLAWTACRYSLRLSNLPAQWKDGFILAPVLVPLICSWDSNSNAFLILSVLNAAIYGIVCFRIRETRIVRHLLFVSLLMVAAGLPATWLHVIAPGLDRAKWIAAAAIAYLVLWTALSRNPKMALAGSFAVGTAVMAIFGNHHGAIHWAFQSGIVFLLLHSLRWNDREHPGALAVRVVFALGWIAQAFVWMRSDEARFWMPMIPGALVLVAYSVAQWLRGRWANLVIPISAVVVILSNLATPTAQGARSLPAGLWAIIGSFVLLGCGTVAALTRHRWHQCEQPADINPPKV
jgi:hypothetical protein